MDPLHKKRLSTKRRGPHPHQALSAAFCRTVAEAGRYCDGNGLYLHVDVSGTRRWVQRLVIRGRSCTLGLGSYKLVSLAEARELALANRKVARSGGDPLANTRSAKGVPTFEEAAEKVIAIHGEIWKHPEKTKRQWRGCLRDHAYTRIGDRSVDQVTTADVMAVLLPLWTRRHATARKLRQRIGAVMKWAVAQGYRTDNPTGDAIAAALPKRANQVRHMPALPHGEVASAVEAVKASSAWVGTKLWCARLTGEGQPVEVRRKEGVTNHFRPESCAGRCEAAGEALTGARTGRAIEHRKRERLERRDCHSGRRQHRHHRNGEGMAGSCARLTGEGQPVKVRRKEGITNHLHPESCAGRCEAAGEALTGARTGRAIEHRKIRRLARRDSEPRRRPHRHHRHGEGMEGATVSKNPCTFVRPSSGPGRSSFCPGSRTGAAAGRRIPYPMMYGMKKSDEAIVPLKAANKGAQAPAESPEGRASTKGNSRDQSTHRTQGRDGVSQVVERIRQAATRAVCRQPPKVGAVCVNAHVRI